MKTLIYTITILYFACSCNQLFAIKPSQQAAINIWLIKQQDINPRPQEIITNLKNKAKQYNIKITHYSIDSNETKLIVKTNKQSNITKYKRILDTTFMFDEITSTQTAHKNNHYYFSLILKKSEIEKRGEFKKTKHALAKSQTQIKHLISKLISKIKPMGQLKYFCPTSPLKIKPNYVGARIKLIIYSYHIKFSGSYTNIKNALNVITNNSKYISMHNLKLNTKNTTYDFDVDLRLYQQGSKRNNLDKVFIFEKVKTDKICE